jgi:probable F420-dependent oxidoreductase
VASAVRIGCAIPQTYDDTDASIDALERFFAHVEDSDIESLWVQEQLLGRDRSFEPLAMLSFAAGRTRRVRLGTAAVIAPLRNPVILAKTLATIDQLSRGRLIVGLALGDALGFYRALGVDPAERAARLDETVEVMRRLWMDEAVTIDGRFTHLDGQSMEPKPVQPGGPPVWFGARSPAGLRRAVGLGDGFVGAGGASIADFREQAAFVVDELGRAGRDRATFTIAKKIYIHVDRDRATATRQLTDWFRIHWGGLTDGEALAAKVGVAGTPSDAVARLREVRAAGADLIILNPVVDEEAQLDLLGASVIPDLRLLD